jgi:hypothetical protein
VRHLGRDLADRGEPFASILVLSLGHERKNIVFLACARPGPRSAPPSVSLALRRRLLSHSLSRNLEVKAAPQVIR